MIGVLSLLSRSFLEHKSKDSRPLDYYANDRAKWYALEVAGSEWIWRVEE